MPLASTLQESVIITMCNLARMFTPGIKLTLVARHMSDEGAFMIFSEDNLGKVIETIQRHMKTRDEAQKFSEIIKASTTEH